MHRILSPPSNFTKKYTQSIALIHTVLQKGEKEPEFQGLLEFVRIF